MEGWHFLEDKIVMPALKNGLMGLFKKVVHGMHIEMYAK